MTETSTQPGEKQLNANSVLAVDVVLFSVRNAEELEDSWQLLLVKSSKSVFGGKRALPGVIVREDERFEEAARRALRTKTGLDARDWYLEQLGTWGEPGRDTRGRVASVAYFALVRSDHLALVTGSTVVDAEWVPVRQAMREELAFDHTEMLRAAVSRVRSKLRYSWVAFQLLPDEFTLPELRGVYASILDPQIARLNSSNFKRAFAQLFESGALMPTGEKRDAEGRGRPGDLYRFSGQLEGTWERELPWHS
jgi:8-oxo-dGTP diphosphatase